MDECSKPDNEIEEEKTYSSTKEKGDEGESPPTSGSTGARPKGTKEKEFPSSGASGARPKRASKGVAAISRVFSRIFLWRKKAEDAQGSENTSDMEAIAVFDKKSKAIQAFKPLDKSWTRLHAVTAEIISKVLFTAVALDDAIIVLAFGKTNFRLKYTDPKPKWIPLPDRSVTDDVVAVVLHGEVYAFDNGYDQYGQNIEKLDIHQTSWSQMTKPFPYCHAAVIAVGDFIYTFGGYAIGGEVLSKAAKFDPNTSTWSDLPSMPTARQHAGVAALDDRIYVMGGATSGASTTTESFDIQSQVWTELKPMTNGHYYFNACTIGGKIYAVGSLASSQSIDAQLIDEYDPDTDTWQTVGTLNGKDIIHEATISISI